MTDDDEFQAHVDKAFAIQADPFATPVPPPAKPSDPVVIMGKAELVDLIMKYEGGDATDSETLRLFAELLRTGLAWSLQGHYGRTAHTFIDAGYITTYGAITEKGKAVT